MGFLGGYQVCHNICLGLLFLLSFLGITIIGMPLLFLNKLAVYFWTFAVVLLIITLWVHLKKRCISQSLLLLNSGIIIAGIPFNFLQKYILLFWIIGGVLIILSILFYFKRRIRKVYK
ncbi:hypothetical protein COV11_00865 [Candidatus Woesearchaeota archaeon CG10_big_fil_rev_8_21_14_0_10_30_7]|nr:MAG: hypothetical protein COV11_00865 [Candidatus Woesearchaeota archaeon CG10_big_fil_rev_8_21_14_0_10_30_7]